jgi:hypothetical protein
MDDEKRIDRLWQHGLHEDVMFNERLNFFLVFESLLIATVASLYNSPHPKVSIIRFIIIIGLLLTGVWSYVQIRQKQTLFDLKEKTKSLDSNYAEILNRRSDSGLRISTISLLAYWVPFLVSLIWFVLLFA